MFKGGHPRLETAAPFPSGNAHQGGAIVFHFEQAVAVRTTIEDPVQRKTMVALDATQLSLENFRGLGNAHSAVSS